MPRLMAALLLPATSALLLQPAALAPRARAPAMMAEKSAKDALIDAINTYDDQTMAEMTRRVMLSSGLSSIAGVAMGVLALRATEPSRAPVEASTPADLAQLERVPSPAKLTAELTEAVEKTAMASTMEQEVAAEVDEAKAGPSPDLALAPAITKALADAPRINLPHLPMPKSPPIDWRSLAEQKFELPSVPTPSVPTPSVELRGLAEVELSSPGPLLPSLEVDLNSIADLPPADVLVPSAGVSGLADVSGLAEKVQLSEVELPGAVAPSLDTSGLASKFDTGGLASKFDTGGLASKLPKLSMPSFDASAFAEKLQLSKLSVPSFDTSGLASKQISVPAINLPMAGIVIPPTQIAAAPVLGVVLAFLGVGGVRTAVAQQQATQKSAEMLREEEALRAAVRAEEEAQRARELSKLEAEYVKAVDAMEETFNALGNDTTGIPAKSR